jgi:parallel beta-helix repeat protein
MKKIVLLAFALLSLCVASLLELQVAHASPYTDIDAETAYNMITNGSYPDLVVLDVRTQSEYDSGHIYGAVWIPHTELVARIGELAGHEDHEIIVYCLYGSRSATASGILDSHNFTKVYNMVEGISAWQSAGHPLWIATVHNINTTFNYDTIQAAIDAPQTIDGHTIRVEAGTYYEHVVVNKRISLFGENRNTTVVDGNGTGNVMDIIAHDIYVTGFTIRNGTNGIFIEDSDYNLISGNIVNDNLYGTHLFATCSCNPTSGNIIRNNTIMNNRYGICLDVSTNNTIYHNNFINNTKHKYYYQYEFYSNVWDNGYPSGGNYWSNYTGIDFYSGRYINETGSDGIGDSPHIIDGNNQDNYPLMGMFSSFNTSLGYYVDVISNSTIENFQFFESNSTIKMHVSNITVSQTYDFCRIRIPTGLMNGTYNVFVNEIEVPHTLLSCSNSTYSYLYFTYNHSTEEVIIITEFPTWISTLLILLILTVAIIICKRARNPSRNSHNSHLR